MNKYLTLIKILTLIGVTSSVTGAMEKCQSIRLPNGRVRIQRQGRHVRFRCLKGYEFVGRRYMNCFRGEWDFERDPSVNPPMCVKPGCRASSYVNGHFLETYKGAVVSVVCDLGYTLIGTSTVYCNGYEWNQPFPKCRAINPTPPKSCDFEDGLCGWTQEPHGDWRWHEAEESAKESSGYGACDEKGVRTRQPYDCGNLGRYMLLGNSSSRIANATERLFSPVFPPEYSKNSCFAFWYTLNGLTAGYLKVFVKPEGAQLYNTIPPFWVNGHQSRSWIPGYFPLYSTRAPFQVVIEGMSLAGNQSETAFDDVKILSGDDCASFREVYTAYLPHTSTTVETSEDEDSVSCLNRCGTTASNSTDRCECRDSCLKDATCCSDYEIFCASEVTTSSSTTVDITVSMTSTEKSLETKTAPTSKVTEESNEIPRFVENGTFGNGSDADFKSWGFAAAGNNEDHLGTEKVSETKRASDAGSHASEATTTSPRPTATTRGPVTTTAAPRRRSSEINFPVHVDPSRSGRVSKMRLNGRIAEDGLRGTGEESPLSITSGGEHSRPTSSGIPPGWVEVVIAVAAVVASAFVIAALVRRRRRRKTEKENMVEDSDSICFGMNPIYEKLSSQSSLICIRPNAFADGEISGDGITASRRSSETSAVASAARGFKFNQLCCDRCSVTVPSHLCN